MCAFIVCKSYYTKFIFLYKTNLYIYYNMLTNHSKS